MSLQYCERSIYVKPANPPTLEAPSSGIKENVKCITAVYLPADKSDEFSPPFIVGIVKLVCSDIATTLENIRTLLKADNVTFSIPLSSSSIEGIAFF